MGQIIKAHALGLLKIVESRERLIIRICEMYYLENKSQQEIASTVGFSRPQISRLLNQARETGVVHINIKNPYAEEFRCEDCIRARFGTPQVIVVNTDGMDRTGAFRVLGNAVTQLLNAVILDKSIIGVLGGETIAGVINNVHYFRRENLNVVPLAGGIGPEGSARQSNQVAKVLGEILRCKYWQLHTPACVATATTCDALLKEPEIQGVLSMARRSTVALMSVGCISPDVTTCYFSNLSKDDMQELIRLGAVSVFGQTFFDKHGKYVPTSINSRMIGITAEDIKQIPHIVAVAVGREKTDAITAALKSGYIETLITDLDTALRLV